MKSVVEQVTCPQIGNSCRRFKGERLSLSFPLHACWVSEEGMRLFVSFLTFSTQVLLEKNTYKPTRQLLSYQSFHFSGVKSHFTRKKWSSLLLPWPCFFYLLASSAPQFKNLAELFQGKNSLNEEQFAISLMCLTMWTVVLDQAPTTQLLRLSKLGVGPGSDVIPSGNVSKTTGRFKIFPRAVGSKIKLTWWYFYHVGHSPMERCQQRYIGVLYKRSFHWWWLHYGCVFLHIPPFFYSLIFGLISYTM